MPTIHLSLTMEGGEKLMKFFYKVGTGIAAMAILSSALATGAFAADLTIEGNGAGSTNTISVSNVCAVNVLQKNKTTSKVNATVTQNTGGNTANNNTGGDVTVESGAATSDITVTVEGSTNDATVPDCCECQSTVDATIKDNGAGSTNTAGQSNVAATSVTQKNKTKSKVKASVKQKTGKNKANNNTNGTVGVTSNDATSTVDVTVTGSQNTL